MRKFLFVIFLYSNICFSQQIGVPVTFHGITTTTPFDQNGAAVLYPGVTSVNGTYGLTGIGILSMFNGVLSTLNGALGTNLGGTALSVNSVGNGNLLIGNGTAFSLNTLTAGTGITITNSAGGISIASSGGYWNTTGNSGTSIGSNFVGTTDAAELGFRVNNDKAGTINHLTPFNTAFGAHTLVNYTSGTQNVCIGYEAGDTLTTGSFNTYIGYQAAFSNLTGGNNTVVGNQAFFLPNGASTQNTVIGAQAVTGSTNNVTSNATAVGYSALHQLTTGASCTGIGLQAAQNNNTGANNTAVGAQAGQTNQSGSFNTSVGYQALFTATTSNNTAVGWEALQAQSTGANNTALGYKAGFTASTGGNNVCLGYQADVTHSSTTNAIAIGNTITADTNQVAIGNSTDTAFKVNGQESSFVVVHGDLGSTSAAANICTFTPAATGYYSAMWSITVTADVTDIAQAQITYTDAHNSASATQSGTALSVSAPNYASGIFSFYAKAGNVITLKVALPTSSGSITYFAHGNIKRED